MFVHSYPQTPLVLDLPAQVQVHLRQEQPVLGAAQTRGAATVRSSDIARPVEVTKVLVCWLSIC